MNFFENITLRRKRTTSLSETTVEESSTNNSTLDGSTSSLPNISDNECDEVQDLKRKIEQLNHELSAAHEEIDQLSIENNDLKSTVIDITKKYDLLKKATKNITTDIRVGSPKPKNTKLSTPQKRVTQQLNKKGAVEDRILPHVMKDHQQSVSDPETPTSAMDISKNMQSTNTQEPQETHLDNGVFSKVQSMIPMNFQTNSLSETRRCKRLCIISSNNVNKLLYLGENTFLGYELCHYIMPNAGINQLFADLDKKLIDFTHEDYCIIYIGERDFEVSNNYRILIDYIKNELKNVMNTNIIICSPNFKLSDNFAIFNKRIEMFNHWMYLDVELCEYAYLFDSNFCLEYTNEMFWKYNARVNNKAVAIIFKNLMYFMNYLDLQTENHYNLVSHQCIDNVAVNHYLNQSGNNNNELHTDRATQTESTLKETENDLFRL